MHRLAIVLSTVGLVACASLRPSCAERSLRAREQLIAAAVPEAVQTDSGRVDVLVREACSGRAIWYARVESVGESADTGRAFTDSSGHAELRSVAGARRLRVRAIGYVPAAISLSVRGGYRDTLLVVLRRDDRHLDLITVGARPANDACCRWPQLGMGLAGRP